MEWTFLDSWIITAGVLSAVSCSLVGNFLVLRKMSMMGDAISHAVLPGLAMAFLITNSRDSVTMFAGAAIVGVLTALFTQWIHTFGKVEESAAMGVVFTALFAVGLILIVQAADAVDLDPGCVLYGAIELIPLDTTDLLGMEVPRVVVRLAIILLVNLAFVGFFYKELRISSFDPALSTTLGINANLMHYILMTLVAVTAVASFESVGSILVIAMLIVPAASAHLLTDRYFSMIFIGAIIAAASAVLGHIAAITVPTWFGFQDTTTAGGMAVVAGLIFFVVMLLAPKYGVLSRAFHRILLSLRIIQEDLLGILFRVEESTTTWESGAIANLVKGLPHTQPIMFWLAKLRLRLAGLIVVRAGSPELTPQGRHRATTLVRSHRLWESYLARHFELAADHLHESAERTEHYLTHTMQDEMALDLENITTDPHGRAIPDITSAEKMDDDDKQE